MTSRADVLTGTAGEVKSWKNLTGACKEKINLLRESDWFCSVTLADIKRKPSNNLAEIKNVTAYA